MANESGGQRPFTDAADSMHDIVEDEIRSAGSTAADAAKTEGGRTADASAAGPYAPGGEGGRTADAGAAGPYAPGGEAGRKSSFVKEWLPYILILAAVLLFRIFFLINATIPTESMSDTIEVGNHIMGLKCTYWFANPQRGDIMVFHAPDEPQTLYIKRVIGVPGDTVYIDGGKTYVNGEALEEDYLPEPMRGTFGPYKVPEGSWFMLGDNRNHSKDARYWKNTWVTKDLIVGKAYFRYWPSLKWLY